MNYMLPVSYAWGNFSVLAVGIWAIVQRDSLDAITMVSIGLPQAAQEKGGGQSLWASDDFQLFPTQQLPVWVGLDFF